MHGLIKITFGGILAAGIVVILSLPAGEDSASLPAPSFVEEPIVLDEGSIKMLLGELNLGGPITIRAPEENKAR